MLGKCIIVLVEELEWISPMAIQNKKIGGIHIYVDLYNLNDAYVCDPFPTPFIDERLENVGGREVYSFTYGFAGYHQVKIIEEYTNKTTFVTWWILFAYIMIPFDLKSALVVVTWKNDTMSFHTTLMVP